MTIAQTTEDHTIPSAPEMQFVLGGDDDPSSQQAVLLASSGSFTGYRPQRIELGKGYLTAGEDFKQPLCGNEEGWGPLSPFRYDFTPCFLDVWVASVALFGLVLGLLAVVWLLRMRKPTEVVKGWHFWTKQVRMRARCALSGLSLFLSTYYRERDRADNFTHCRVFLPSSSPISPPSSSSKLSAILIYGLATSGYGRPSSP